MLVHRLRRWPNIKTTEGQYGACCDISMDMGGITRDSHIHEAKKISGKIRCIYLVLSKDLEFIMLKYCYKKVCIVVAVLVIKTLDVFYNSY